MYTNGGMGLPPDGAYCALTALDFDTPDREGAARALEAEVPKGSAAVRSGNPYPVIAYNDHPRRKKAEILALYDRAITKARAQRI